MGDFIGNKGYVVNENGEIIRNRKCPKCGRTLFSEGDYCEYCGAKVSIFVQGEMENSPHELEYPNSLTERILSILKQGNKLQAVKIYKEETGVDLKKAKEYVDGLCKKNHIGSNAGCYIATAVYGSYDCPEVWTLRRYRDNMLDHSWYGRLFIRIYYAVSPALVKWFGKANWFGNLFRNPLDKWVDKLNECGFENTPYEDKY